MESFGGVSADYSARTRTNKTRHTDSLTGNDEDSVRTVVNGDLGTSSKFQPRGRAQAAACHPLIGHVPPFSFPGLLMPPPRVSLPESTAFSAGVEGGGGGNRGTPTSQPPNKYSSPTFRELLGSTSLFTFPPNAFHSTHGNLPFRVNGEVSPVGGETFRGLPPRSFTEREKRAFKPTGVDDSPWTCIHPRFI
ncbi:hypothetical protein K0M31_020406 [Melipona bicolor]|uniref:Uncharacterized protein n=1 Tax=Melipona bicolor TaxID=60889 RepID=A0AA40G1K8_9HYME|nr:hypothetical protein K0M31_020406 [Melipona bicolor]